MVVLIPFAPPEEGIVHKQECTQAHINAKSMGKGTIYIAESRLSWRNENGEGFSLEYPAVSLHAISRDLSSFPHPCLYLMVDANLNQDEGSESNDSSTEDSGSSGQISEVRFVPEDTLSLEHMYKAMCDCQALHPDEDDTNSDDDVYGNESGQGDFFSTQADIDHLTTAGHETLQRLDHMLRVGAEGVTVQQQGTSDAVNGVNTNQDTEMETGEEEQFEDADMDR